MTVCCAGDTAITKSRCVYKTLVSVGCSWEAAVSRDTDRYSGLKLNAYEVCLLGLHVQKCMVGGSLDLEENNHD